MHLHHTNAYERHEGMEREFWLLVSLVETTVALAIHRGDDPEEEVRKAADAGLIGMVAYRKRGGPENDVEITVLSEHDARVTFMVRGCTNVDMVYLGNPLAQNPPGQPTRTPLGDGRIAWTANIVCGQKYMQEKRKKEESHG